MLCFARNRLNVEMHGACQKVSDHNADFHALNRELTREYARLSTGHTVGGTHQAVVGGELDSGESDLPTVAHLMAETAKSSGLALGSGEHSSGLHYD